MIEKDCIMYLMKCYIKNWGDDVSIPLVKFITGETPICVRSGKIPPGEIGYIIVGSILHWATSNTIVWGSGFMSVTDNMKCQPKEIHAVRGPKSRDKLLAQGLTCPEVYGDPALLYPKFYKPAKVEKKYKLGIIPHHVDRASPLVKSFRDKSDIFVINILGPINQVVDDICSCERVASSCLHGIICADAYGVPSTWVKFSEKVYGKGFKFGDYFVSVGRKDIGPLVMKESTSVQQILDQFYDYKIDIDLDKLYDACPFRRKS